MEKNFVRDRHKSFKKCCITNALDGSEDDIIWDDSEAENESNSEGESDEEIKINFCKNT